jgi:hypothetical protein
MRVAKKKDEERVKLQWQYEQFYAQFMFLLDLGWKAVGLFYAVLGGILIVSFAKDPSDKHVIKFLLYAPYCMSITLSAIFLFCGVLWLFRIRKFNTKVASLYMTTLNFHFLNLLYFVFGGVLAGTTCGLRWLIEQLDKSYS